MLRQTCGPTSDICLQRCRRQRGQPGGDRAKGGRNPLSSLLPRPSLTSFCRIKMNICGRGRASPTATTHVCPLTVNLCSGWVCQSLAEQVWMIVLLRGRHKPKKRLKRRALVPSVILLLLLHSPASIPQPSLVPSIDFHSNFLLPPSSCYSCYTTALSYTH